jgi:hypothetical protein
MRASKLVGTVAGIILTVQAATLRGDSGKEIQNERIARLIKQLGDDAFAKRQAASKELDAIGQPAVAALRKAAESSGDVEIRRRAHEVIQALRVRGERAELSKWEGMWRRSHGVALTIKGDRWTWLVGGKPYSSGQIRVVQLQYQVKADFVHTAGPAKGYSAKAIVQIRDGALYYSGTDPLAPHADYPRDFQKADEFSRVRRE